MDTLQTLGVALGLAALAGLNLYLTVFVTGLAVHFGWVALPPALASLQVLGDPWILWISGVLYFLEFLADKIPWVDTVNDAVHTVVRPLGGALIAVLALGDAHPTVKVVAALLGGSVALTAHTAKAGARLMANASPEPFSNIGLSLGEDAVVVAGLSFLHFAPIAAFFTILILLVAVWVVLPRLLRLIRATFWLAWSKLNTPPVGAPGATSLQKLPDPCELLLRRACATTETFVLVVPCLSGGGPRLPRYLFGWLVQFEEGRLFFVSRFLFGSLVLHLPLPSRPAIERQSRFLTEKLVLGDGKTYTFLFDRGNRALADEVAERLGPSLQPLPAD